MFTQNVNIQESQLRKKTKRKEAGGRYGRRQMAHVLLGHSSDGSVEATFPGDPHLSLGLRAVWGLGFRV